MASVRFFEYLSNRLNRYALRKLHLHHFVGKQLERPVGMSFGRVAASYGNQMRFLSAVQLSLLSRQGLCKV